MLPDGQLETAEEMGRALRARHVTSLELVERALARAQAWQPSINAFSQLWVDRAMDEARRIDSTRPEERAPLAGVPIAVKDLFDVAGEETSGCCAAYRGTIAQRDAPVIERTRRAGLVIVGKTNQHELAAGGTNLVSACGRTGNPWDPDRMTGGSSGGSAAAVAAGIVPWALGSDTGGSIRIPSSMCGIFGLKPTFGLIPTEGVMPLAPSMDCPGPIASTLEDLYALFALLADAPVPSLQPFADEPFRVGIPGGFFVDRVHDEVLEAVQNVGRALETTGAVVQPVGGSELHGVRSLWMRVCCPEFAHAHPLLKDPERRRLVAPSVLEWLDLGERQTEQDQEEAVRERERIGYGFERSLDGLDALVIPTTPYPAPRADQERVDLGKARTVEVTHVGPGWLTCSVNLAGLPGINLPAGRSSQGLPIGVSLVARAGGEDTLHRLAADWLAAAEYRAERPAPPWPGPPAA